MRVLQRIDEDTIAVPERELVALVRELERMESAHAALIAAAGRSAKTGTTVPIVDWLIANFRSYRSVLSRSVRRDLVVTLTGLARRRSPAPRHGHQGDRTEPG
jgi:hypothetical protein